MLKYGGTLYGCSARRRKPLIGEPSSRFSTAIADVTCAWCRERFEQLVLYWATPRDPVFAGLERPNGVPLGPPAAAVFAAHELCCAARGAPLMVDAGELEGWGRAQLARLVYLPPVTMALDERGLESAVERITATDADVAEALRPAIDGCTLALDLVIEAQRLLDQAAAHVASVKRQILAGEIGEPLVAVTKERARNERAFKEHWERHYDRVQAVEAN